MERPPRRVVQNAWALRHGRLIGPHGLEFHDVPFPDETLTVTMRAYDPTWPADFTLIAAELRAALGDLARTIDHVGSTSIPGMAAKDCIDIQIRVDRVDSDTIAPALFKIGYRLRDEPWNTSETSFGVTSPKLVFAPPVGARRANVHVRAFGSANARFALLFRDYLRRSPIARQAWADFKLRLAQDVTDLYSYGQIKQPAMMVLMEAARCWAAESAWSPPD